MANPALEDDIDEKPLDPAMQRLRAKMMRLMIVSVGIMIAGVMAVLFAVVYKVSSGGAAPETALAGSIPTGGDPFAATITLPGGASVNSHSISGNTVSFDITRSDGGRELRLYDAVSGNLRGVIALTGL
jgi:hypothetical protein